MHVKKVSFLWFNKRNPANISCSESLIVILEKGLKNMFKMNKKDTRTTSLTRFWCLIFNLEHISSFSLLFVFLLLTLSMFLFTGNNLN